MTNVTPQVEHASARLAVRLDNETLWAIKRAASARKMTEKRFVLEALQAKGVVIAAIDLTGVAALPPVGLGREGAEGPAQPAPSGATLREVAAALEGRGLTLYLFRGRPCVIAGALGKALDYPDVMKRIRNDWAAEMIEGRDLDVLRGADLHEFKALAELTPPFGINANICGLTILYESGVAFVCQRTPTPAGRRLRRSLAERRSGRPVAADAEEPVAPVRSQPAISAGRPDLAGAAPARAPSAPGDTPIVLNGDGNEVLLGQHRIPVYVFRGAVVMIAGHLDAPLDYEPKGIAQLLRGEWSNEVREGEHVRTLTGADLREFKAVAALGGTTPPSGLPPAARTGTTPVSRNARSLTILTEAGIDRVLLLTKKPAGVRLRAFIADTVLPRLRRGEAVPPVVAADPGARHGGAHVDAAGRRSADDGRGVLADPVTRADLDALREALRADLREIVTETIAALHAAAPVKLGPDAEAEQVRRSLVRMGPDAETKAEQLRGALVGLGWKRGEANRAVQDLSDRLDADPLATLVRAALALLRS
jgi:hypothetical protein